MTNKDIVGLFRDVAASYSIKNEAKFRFQIIAYQNAAEAVILQRLQKEGI